MNLFIEMIFRDGFYHADPHPGNLMVLTDHMMTNEVDVAVLGILDCGMVGRIDDKLRDDLELALIASVGQDAATITEVVARIGEIPSDFDEPALLGAIQELIDEYSHQSLSEFDLSGCLH